jgi:hypothetical protein
LWGFGGEGGERLCCPGSFDRLDPGALSTAAFAEKAGCRVEPGMTKEGMAVTTICGRSSHFIVIPIAAVQIPAKSDGMKRFANALFSMKHITILLIAVWFGMAFMAGDALGFFQPDYRKLLFTIILAYWAGVFVELGIFDRWGKRR